MNRSMVIVGLAATVVWGGQARATARCEEAGAEVRAARARSKRGDHDGADRALSDLYQRCRAVEALFERGENYRREGRLAEAVAAYRRFLDWAGDGSRLRRQVGRARSEVERIHGQVQRLYLRGEQKGVRVVVDGKERGLTPLPGPLYLPPGRHTLMLERKGYVGRTQAVVAEAGQKAEINVDLRRVEPARQPLTADNPRPPSPAVPPKQPSPQKPEPEPAQVSTPDEAEGPGWWRRPTMWTALGGGAVLLATAGALYGVYYSRGMDAFGRAEDADFWSNDYRLAYDDLQHANRGIAAGHALAAVGGAALVAALLLYLTGDEAPPPASVSLSPAGGHLTLTF